MKPTKKDPERSPNVAEYVEALKKSRQFGDQVVCHHEKGARAAVTGNPDLGWPESIEQLLKALSIPQLF